ncbi:MAG: peptidylprolyl isomerase [Candidatus Competibacteraceae bacterium]|nr:peptidylprolyl isomerase [Candidatus Competibacteraceae bacterium]
MPNCKHRLVLLALLLTPSYSLYAADPAEQPPSLDATDSLEPQPTVAPEPPGPAATVNGTPISRDLVEAYTRVSQGQNANNAPVDSKSLVNELINQELLLQEAEQQKLVEQDPQLAMQLEVVRRNMIATAAMRKVLREQQPSEEDFNKEIERLSSTLTQKEYKVRHILVDSEDKAKAVIEELKGGADFSETAKTQSSDNSATDGGQLEWFTVDIMPEPFGNAVTTLSKGNFTEQPVQTQFGWHIILLDDMRDGAPPSAQELNQRVVREMQDRIMNEHLEKLRSAATIEIK